MAEGHRRPAWATVDLGAVAHNVALLRRLVAPAQLCAVVKADGYGHGALTVARAALEAGAASLAVALVEEGMELRRAGIDAPVLVLSEPVPGAVLDALACDLTLTVYRREGVQVLAQAAATMSRRPVAVHLKVDTGMHRVGAHPEQALAVALAIAGTKRLRLEGLWTHLAVADDVEDTFTAEQLARFEAVRRALADAGVVPEMVHAANSAAAIAHPASRYDLVRCGLAVYGYPPTPAVGTALEAALGPGTTLRPVLGLLARVSLVRDLEAGERVSYGRVRPLPCASRVAVVPLGYADGVPRRLLEGGMEVLVGGRRRPLAGTVTMDQLMVDCGPGAEVEVGDEVVLLGRQGQEEITAEDWARALGTISYEVLCAIAPRVPRVVVPAVAAGARAGAAGPGAGDQGGLPILAR